MDKLGRFQCAYDFMRSTGAYHTKTELAKIMGRTREHVSGAYYGRSPFFNDSFLHSFCVHFPRISEDWLIRGIGAMEKEECHTTPSSSDNPAWADTLISIMSEQIKQNEALNRELRRSIDEIHALRDELLRSSHQYSMPQQPSRLVAEQ